MHIDSENITPERPAQQQQFDLTQDFMDDNQVDTQLSMTDPNIT